MKLTRASLIVSIMLCCSLSQLYAQYLGGNDDGYAKVNSPNLLLDGSGPPEIYNGGVGDGYASARSSPHTSINMDIKPQSCPNPLNIKRKGVLPVAILGSANFDVNDVDVSSVELEGVSPLRSSIEDVSTPVADPQDECDCTTDGADGFDDLTLKFDTQDIVTALGTVNDGDTLVLTLTGNLNDGTPLEGQDCIIIKAKGGKSKKAVAEAETEGSAPDAYALLQNHPNPFNPSTQIQFALPNASHVKLEVYNALGERIATLVDETRPAGYHVEQFDATGLASGIYLYRLQAGDFIDTKKLLLLK